jgi:hypothetical protein
VTVTTNPVEFEPFSEEFFDDPYEAPHFVSRCSASSA